MDFARARVDTARPRIVATAMLAQSGQRFDALEHAWRDALEGPPKVAAGSL